MTKKLYRIVLYDAEHTYQFVNMSEAAVCLRFSFNMKVCQMKEVKHFAPYSDSFSEIINNFSFSPKWEGRYVSGSAKWDGGARTSNINYMC